MLQKNTGRELLSCLLKGSNEVSFKGYISRKKCYIVACM